MRIYKYVEADSIVENSRKIYFKRLGNKHLKIIWWLLTRQS